MDKQATKLLPLDRTLQIQIIGMTFFQLLLKMQLQIAHQLMFQLTMNL